MVKIAVVLGTRPEIIKFAPLYHKAQERGHDVCIVFTGQHYEHSLSSKLFQVLNLPDPDYNLNITEEQTVIQLGKMIIELGKVYKAIEPEIVLAVGDTNSALAACLTANKLRIPFGHIEAGLRSFDNTMQEEINRKLIDSMSNLLFAPSINAVVNLHYEGVDPDRIFFTGNTIVDAIYWNLEQIKKGSLTISLPKEYILVTIHRENNVENKKRLFEIVQALLKSTELTFLFVLHPRTEKKLKELGLDNKLAEAKNIHLVSPLSYVEFLSILNSENCKMVITDSGGLQEEAFYLNKKCLTIRNNTERPETITYGLNTLVAADSNSIRKSITSVLNKSVEVKIDKHKPYGDGTASERILKVIEEYSHLYYFQSPLLLETGTRSYFLLFVKDAMTRDHIEKNFNCKITAVYDEVGVPVPIPEVLNPGYRCRVITEK
ncbi:MAG: non-hydrolyzing UDP-N-acetylglucosamine 2-epimerase [Candidatus Heimdallarchaeaceae archaeon]